MNHLCKQIVVMWGSFQTYILDMKPKALLVLVFFIVFLFYSVKEGIFRQYVGPRALADFQEYLDLGQWNDTEPVPSWKAPDSFL